MASFRTFGTHKVHHIKQSEVEVLLFFLRATAKIPGPQITWLENRITVQHVLEEIHNHA